MHRLFLVSMAAIVLFVLGVACGSEATPTATPSPVQGSQTLFLNAGTSDAVSISLHANNRVTGSVQNSLGMDISILDPFGNTIQKQPNTTSWSFAFTASADGTYKISVYNDALLASKQSQLSWTIYWR